MTKRTRGKRTKLERQVMLTFEYHEQLEPILRDLGEIDKLIPWESSRSGGIMRDVETRCIIEHRKDSLLRYIQVICRDHLHFAKKYLKKRIPDHPWEVKR